MSSYGWSNNYYYKKPTVEELQTYEEYEYCEIQDPENLPSITFINSGEDYLRNYMFSWGEDAIRVVNKHTKTITDFISCEHSVVKWIDENGEEHIENGMEAPYIDCGTPKCVSYDYDFTHFVTDYSVVVYDVEKKTKTTYILKEQKTEPLDEYDNRQLKKEISEINEGNKHE